MDCAKCGQPVGDADVFCGTCGADLNAQRAAAAQQPTAVMPPPPPPTAPGQPTEAMPPAPQYAAQQPSPAPGVQPPPLPTQAAPSKQNKAALWIVLGIVAALLLFSCGSAGVWAFMFGPFKKEPPAPESVSPLPPSDGAESPAEESIPDVATSATPDEAVRAAIPKDWVIRKVNESPQQVEYWAGPPNSEFTTVYLVNAQPAGGWLMTESYPLQAGGDVQPTDEAKATVEQFLKLIQADKPMEAQALTVEPFRSDGASAEYSNGEFLSFSIDKVEDAGDNTVFVTTTEKWKSSTDRWTYRVVPTEAGMRISELMPAR